MHFVRFGRLELFCSPSSGVLFFLFDDMVFPQLAHVALCTTTTVKHRQCTTAGRVSLQLSADRFSCRSALTFNDEPDTENRLTYVELCQRPASLLSRHQPPRGRG
jgi:hypothetical protein